MKILITGGAGFIGHHVAEFILTQTDHEIILLDRLDVSGNLNRLAEIGVHDRYRSRCRFIFHNLRGEVNQLLAAQIGPIDTILHMAAATHVDRSIDSPMDFVQDNIIATVNLLDYARHLDSLKQFIYFSTDEVFGPAPDGVNYGEWCRYKSGNPYAATKAGAEELCVAYHNTYGLPVRITHCMNVFGERQHPEKYIPLAIGKICRGETLTIHANKEKTRAGSRFYIHAKNVADAVFFVIKNGEDGEKYNIVGEQEVDNLQLAKLIASVQDKELQYEMVDFHSSRPGHDLRYALDGSKLATMGWKPPSTFEQSLQDVTLWTLNNSRWML